MPAIMINKGLMNSKKDTFIPVARPLLPNDTHEFVSQCVQKNLISSSTHIVKDFEEIFSKSINRKYGFSCNSGTQALTIAVKSLKLEPGSKILIPNFCIISMLLAVIDNNCVPVFVEPSDGFNLSLEDIEKHYTEDIKCIIIAHMYGLAVDAKSIEIFCKKNKVFLIEDAAEAHGQLVNEKPCGSFGDVSIFSFFANKHVTCGEGGFIASNNKKISKEIALIKNLYFDKKRSYKHKNIGQVGRMTSMQAALGIKSFRNLQNVVNKKIRIGKFYDHLFKEKNVQTPDIANNVSINHYWVYPLIFESAKDRTMFQNFLEKKNIDFRRLFYPLDRQTLLKKFNIFKIKNNNTTSLNFYEKGLYIPTGPLLYDHEMIYLEKAINEFF